MLRLERVLPSHLNQTKSELNLHLHFQFCKSFSDVWKCVILYYITSLLTYIHHHEQVEPRLSILTKRMILLSEHYQDIKRFGPFGHRPPAQSVTECDNIALIESAGTLYAIFAQFSPVNHSLTAIQFTHKLNRIPLNSDERKPRDGSKFLGTGTQNRRSVDCSPVQQGHADDPKSIKHRKGEDPDKIGLCRGDLLPCKIHKTTAPHAGEFHTLTEHSFVERLVLSDNEFIVTAQLAMTEVRTKLDMCMCSERACVCMYVTSEISIYLFSLYSHMLLASHTMHMFI